MYSKEKIEQELWEYLDGVCTETDRARISALLNGDEEWKAIYNELEALHKCIGKGMEADVPPVRFTRNVMDAIELLYPMPAREQYINRKVIRGIAAVFLAGIGLLLFYSIAQVNWNTVGNGAGVGDLTMPSIKLDHLFNPAIFNVVIGLNVVLGLVFLDFALIAKRTRHY